MTGKRAVAYTTENKPFAKNLRGLMAERGENQKELAEKLGVKQQTISYYRNGQSTPDAENLIKIAQHYGVSTDYLLGLSGDIRTMDTSVKTICEYTGLSENSVIYLHDKYTQTDRIKKIKESATPLLQQFINALLDGADWVLIELGISLLLEMRDVVNNMDTVSENLLPEIFRLEEEISIKSQGLFQMQPIYNEIDRLYSNTLEDFGAIIDKITSCYKVKDTARDKWESFSRGASRYHAENAGGETNAEA